MSRFIVYDELQGTPAVGGLAILDTAFNPARKLAYVWRNSAEEEDRIACLANANHMVELLNRDHEMRVQLARVERRSKP